MTPLKRWLGLVVLLAVVVAVYYPGLDGPFLLDDRENITGSPALRMTTLSLPGIRDAMFSWGEWTPHRGIARVSFALNYYFAGGKFDAYAFKLTNVVIHVLNGLLVYWLSVLLLRRYAGVTRSGSARAGWSAMQSYLPLLVAALWVLHPIQLTSVLYVVQRMTSMSALLVLAGLLLFVAGRIRLESGRASGLAWMFAGLAGGAGLGYFCKQNAVLLPFYAFLVELFFFRHKALPVVARRRLYGFYALTVGLPVVAGFAGLIFAWDVIAQGYAYRDFTPLERMLTESRVLFFYLGLLLVPHIRSFGLYHDDLIVSTGLLTPWTTLVSVLLWAVLLGLALWGVRRRAIWSFALLWYLVGHSLESTFVSLELVFEHRNYLPSFGILFALAYYLVSGLERLANGRRLVYPLVGLLVVVLSFITFTRAGTWGDRYTVIEYSLRNHPNSSRTHGEFAIVNANYFQNVALSYKHLARAAELNPNSVLELIGMDRVLVTKILVHEQQDSGDASVSTEAAPPTDFRAPLGDDLDYMRKLDSVLAKEIATRLETRPMIMGNVAALRTLHECIQNLVEQCIVLLPRAVHWFELAIANPRQVHTSRAVLQLGVAKLYAYIGQDEKAVSNAQAALQSDPGQIHYLFELAALYLRLGDLDAAQRSIEAAGRSMSYSGFRHGVLRDLKNQLEQARGKENGAPSASG